MGLRTVHVNLLGGFAITRPDGTLVSLPLTKGAALFAYLVMTAPKMQSRDRLSDLFWTDYPRPQARVNLRQTLMRLRRALSPVDDLFKTEADGVGLRPVGLWADATEFVRLSHSEDPDDWAAALDLYGGDLMAGFTVDAPAFDEWLVIERQRLIDIAARTAGRLLDRYDKESRLDEAIAVAHRLLALDNFREDAHRTLIDLLNKAGRKDAAIAQYHRLEDLLRTELDAEPAPQTQALLRSVIDDTPSGPGESESREQLNVVTGMAVGYLREAANRAHQRGAHAEAATLYQQGLDLVTRVEDTPWTDELKLRTALQREYYALGRFDDSLAELRTIARTAEAAGDVAGNLRAQCDQAQVLRVLGRFAEGTTLARNALAGAQASGDQHLEALANLRLAALHFHSGEYRRALPLLIVNVEVLDAILSDIQDDAEPGHAAVRSRSWLAWICAELGRFDEGAAYGEQGVRLADETGEMYARIHSRIAMGVLRLRQSDWPACTRWLREALALSERAELPIFDVYIKPALALSLAEGGDAKAATELLQDFKLSSNRAIALSTMADVNRLLGRLDVARTLSMRAIHRAQMSGERGDEGWARHAAGLAALAMDALVEADEQLVAAGEIADLLAMAPLRQKCRVATERLLSAQSR